LCKGFFFLQTTFLRLLNPTSPNIAALADEIDKPNNAKLIRIKRLIERKFDMKLTVMFLLARPYQLGYRVTSPV
jgi:hypothetical protein